MQKQSVRIVGDIGINHQGKLDLALKLIRQAKWAGFDFVKFQKRNPELYPDKPYKSPLFGDVSYKEHKKLLEFDEAEYNEIDKYCKTIGIQWFASPFDIDSIEFLTQYQLEYLKIPSPCITNLSYLERINIENSYLIMSTGMSALAEMDTAIALLLKLRRYDDFALLHCCSEYPTPLEHINLNTLFWMKLTYPCEVGYSSHDAGVAPSVAAVALGATWIEVHITLNRALPGSDHAASLEREEMERLVRHIRSVEKALGVSEKQFYEGERKIREKVTQIGCNA